VVTIKELKKYKETNDKNKDNTYMSRRKTSKDWYSGELCMVREVCLDSFKLFRPMNGKVYSLTENDLDDFVLIGVII